jgi:hypothetical protein
VTSQLSAIPAAKRRQLAATLGLFAMLFLAVGAVAATGANTAVTKTFVVIALVVALLLSLVAWGVLHSVKLDAAKSAGKRVDDAIEAALRANARSICTCGHEHDPDELHFTDGLGQHLTGAKCDHDGRGVDCTHSCETCVLSAMRPAPAAVRPGPGRHRRPSPTPR